MFSIFTSNNTVDFHKYKAINSYNSELFPNQQILDFSKLNELADDNFKFDENGRKLS